MSNKDFCYHKNLKNECPLCNLMKREGIKEGKTCYGLGSLTSEQARILRKEHKETIKLYDNFIIENDLQDTWNEWVMYK